MINQHYRILRQEQVPGLPVFAVAVLFGWHSMKNTKLDAIPDLSDTQVIVYAKWDRSPDIMEDQVTLSDHLGAAGHAQGEGHPRLLRLRLLLHLHHLRGRHRHLLGALAHPGISELDHAAAAQGRQRELAKDATAVGWVYPVRAGRYQRPVLAWTRCAATRTGTCATPCRRCRAWPKWRRSAASCAQYQVNVDPNKLLGYKIPINMVVDAVQKSNNDVGGRLVELSGREYMVRGRGYIKSLDDIREHRR